MEDSPLHVFLFPRCIWTSVLLLTQKWSYPWSSCLSGLPPISPVWLLTLTKVDSMGLQVTMTSLHLDTHSHILGNKRAQGATAASGLSRSLSMVLLILQWDSNMALLLPLCISKKDKLHLIHPFTPQFKKTMNI